MPVYTGTAREQWAEAGVDLALGRITAAELHELGRSIFREADIEDSFGVEELQREVYGLEDELHSSQREVEDVERERDRAVERAEAAEAGVEELKKTVAELERTIRGLQLEGRKA